MILQTQLKISHKATKEKNEMISVTKNKKQEPLTHQTIWWNSHGRLLKHGFYTWRENFLRNHTMGKTQRKKRITHGIKMKRIEARQNWKEERKKERSNKEIDYGRWKESQWKWDASEKKRKMRLNWR